MARRLIGLDIGTNAVRVAELELSEPPRLTSFASQTLLAPHSTRTRPQTSQCTAGAWPAALAQVKWYTLLHLEQRR